MIIPEDVSFIDFYIAAKAKGIKISSRYKGVYCFPRKNGIVWYAKCMRNGVRRTSGTFPFTKEGEIAARQAYERFSSEQKNN